MDSNPQNVLNIVLSLDNNPHQVHNKQQYAHR
jgi:hypothetical protein